MAFVRSVLTVLLHGTLISAPFLLVFVIGYSNKAPAIVGYFGWFEIIVLGFPWNILIGMLVDIRVEQAYAPGLFAALNENHDLTTGYFLFIGYVSVFLNGLVVATLLQFRKRKNSNNRRSENGHA